MSELEERYRRVLRLLPASYRAVWEEEMVATFLDSMHSEDPEQAEWLTYCGRPSRSEVASVAALAVRLRLGGADAPPRSFAWGQAVRRVALVGLLTQAMFAPIGLVEMLWAAGKISWLPTQPDDAAFFHVPPSVVWHIVLSVAGLTWVAALLAFVFGRRRAGRLLALVAFVAFVADTIVTTVDLWVWRAPAITFVELWLQLLITAVLVLALVAFHRDAPPLPRRPWVAALAVGLALSPILPLVFLSQQLTAPPSWWWMLLDWPGLWSVALVTAAVVHLAGLATGQAHRAPSWPLALALLAPAVLAVRVLTLLQYASMEPVGVDSLLAVGIVQAVAVVAVGVTLAVLAAQALRRLPPTPAVPRRRNLTTPRLHLG